MFTLLFMFSRLVWHTVDCLLFLAFKFSILLPGTDSRRFVFTRNWCKMCKMHVTDILRAFYIHISMILGNIMKKTRS